MLTFLNNYVVNLSGITPKTSTDTDIEQIVIVANTFALYPTYAAEVFKTINGLRETAKVGVDEIPSILLKFYANAFVVPLARDNFENYRLVTLIPVISKIIV